MYAGVKTSLREVRAAGLQTVLDARPDVLNHNVETVPRLYPIVRPQAQFARSLALLKRSGELAPGIPTKSGFMLGLGEVEEEIVQLLQSLREQDVDIVTIGQYLRPTPQHLPVVRYVEPAEFERYRTLGLAMGFRDVASGPLVRSSFHAEETLMRAVRGAAAV